MPTAAPGPSDPHRDGAGGGEAQVRVALRPIGSPLPLGFFAFGVGTTLFSALQIGWVPVDQGKQVAIIMLAFVAPLELVASLFSFPGRDPGAASALGIFGGLWLATGVNLLIAPPGSTSVALGTFLLTVSVFILALGAASASDKPVLAAVLVFAFVRFGLSGGYEASMSRTVELAAGWAGIPLALAALYGGLALVLEDAQKRTVLPLARRGAARRSIESGLDEQVEAIAREAGVRNQL